MGNSTCDILIPFFYSKETPERLENLKKCVTRLNEIGIAPIIGTNQHPNINATYDCLLIPDLEHFNKCVILNRLIEYSQTDKFFVLDADIIVPQSFKNYLSLCIDDTAYFPICYRLNKDKPMEYNGNIDSLTDDPVDANGGWCEGGYGLFGISKKDWTNLGIRYNEEIGRSWGVEDDDIYFKLKSKMACIRHKCTGLFHIWHPKSFEYKNANHPTKPVGDFHMLRRDKYDKYMRNPIQEKYDMMCRTQSDINEHLPILKEYADRCNHITEMGVRWMVSTWAFLNSKAKEIVSYDIQKFAQVNECQRLCSLLGRNWTFIEQDVLKADIEETDFLFIDTYHTAEQLKQELALHSSKVRKYIGFHDTTTFWERGEDSYPAVSELQTHSEQGLKYAIEPFLADNSEWEVVYRTEKNNGLMIIGRKNA